MSDSGSSIAEQVEAIYRASRLDPDLTTILGTVDAPEDDDLAELIEADGRLRITLARPVDLRRYLDAVPSLKRREVALDAAIDVTLRARSGGSRPSSVAVQSLVGDYPELRDAIGDAALLADAVVSTTGVSRMVQATPNRDVPAEFGPLIKSGRPRYQLTKLLGSGSAGEVYQAIDRQLSEKDRPAYVAIKLLTGRERGKRARHLLIEEATKARRVVHDNVVRVLDRGVSDEDEDYIVYEHVEGGDLDDWFKRLDWRVPVDVAAKMVARIARGVQAAHSAGLVHCDLKPSNVLVTESGEPKVCDFGIAVRESDMRRAQAGAIKPIGNVAFISPEQYRAEEGSLSPPSDVYALAGILYYLLTHELPNGDSLSAVAKTHDPVSGRALAPNPQDARSDVDSDLAAICRRSMSLRPADRHASAATLAEDLEAWARREPIAWTRPTLWKVAKLAARRRPGVAIAWAFTAAAVIAGVGAAGYWASVATKSKKVAEVADKRMTSERDRIGTFIKTLRLLNKQGFGMDLVPTVVVLESLYGVSVLGTPENRTEAWAMRNDTIRSFINESIRTGHGSDIEVLMWQGVLGYWLLNANQLEEAERLLSDAAHKWSVRDTTGDPITKQVRLLSVSASVKKLAMLSKDRPLTAPEREGLAGFEAELKHEADVFSGHASYSPMRRQALSAIVELYGPAVLDKPAELKAAKSQLKKFDDL